MENPEIIPKFELPLPPELTVEEILGQRTRTNLHLRSPNCYFIYKQAYIKQLKKLVNINNISVDKIATCVNKSWRAESATVKEEYKKLSVNARDRLYQLRLRQLYKLWLRKLASYKI